MPAYVCVCVSLVFLPPSCFLLNSCVCVYGRAGAVIKKKKR